MVLTPMIFQIVYHQVGCWLDLLFDDFILDCFHIIVEAASYGCREYFITVLVLCKNSYLELIDGEYMHMVLNDTVVIYSSGVLEHSPQIVVGLKDDLC